MFPNNIKVKIGNQEEISITEEEFEDLVDRLIENRWYITKVSYSFPEISGLEMKSEFTEYVTVVGNTKDWSYGDDNRS